MPGLLRSDRGGLSVSSPSGERKDACSLRVGSHCGRRSDPEVLLRGASVMQPPHKDQCEFPVRQSAAHHGVGAGRHRVLLCSPASEAYFSCHWDRFVCYRNHPGWTAAQKQTQNFLSEVVHLTCCRICVLALSGTIHYHNRWARFMVD